MLHYRPAENKRRKAANIAEKALLLGEEQALGKVQERGAILGPLCQPSTYCETLLQH